ncbi:MAG: MlaD family protein [Syntrophotaleaceae bacterium]
MAGNTNKAVIGAFVLGALALLVAGVLFFGSGKFFADTRKFVIYFQGSVKGLNVGSPVIFRGVEVGSVTDINIVFDPKEMKAVIPVIVEFDRDKFSGGEKEEQYLQRFIDMGLRAQLQTQSLVTGQLAIYIDFFPGTPVVLRGGPDTRYPEIPSILSTSEELQKTLADLPVEELMGKVHSAMDGIDRLVNSPDLREAISSLDNVAKELQETIPAVRKEIVSVGQDTRKTAQAATRALNEAGKFLAMKEGRSGEMSENIDEMLVEAKETLAAVRRTASDERSIYQLQVAMGEISKAARSIKNLVDYLEQHPEALIKGKGALEGE